MHSVKTKPSADGIEVWNNLSAKVKDNLTLYLAGENGQPVEIGMFTCANCPEVKTCPFAFDAYNTDGDCLKDK